jgi:hypothetical protein
MGGRTLDAALADHGDPGLLCQMQGGRQAGGTAADDQNVCRKSLGHGFQSLQELIRGSLV